MIGALRFTVECLTLKDYIHFHVGEPSTPWHLLFETMEAVKRDFPEVEDYSVSETTLEQVFLSFAKKQRIEDEENDDVILEEYMEDTS